MKIVRWIKGRLAIRSLVRALMLRLTIPSQNWFDIGKHKK
jgi:hypothetical protein